MPSSGRPRKVTEEECEIIFHEYLMREDYKGGRITVTGIHKFYDQKIKNGQAIGTINRILPLVNDMSFNDYFSEKVMKYNQALASEEEEGIGIGVLDYSFDEFASIYPNYNEGFDFFQRVKNDLTDQLKNLHNSKHSLIYENERLGEKVKTAEAEIADLKKALKEARKEISDAENRSRQLISRNERETKERAKEFREETKNEKEYELTAKQFDFAEKIKAHTRKSLEVLDGGGKSE